MPALRRLTISSTQFFENIMSPAIGDIVPETNYYNGLLGEVTVLDNVSDSAKILSITPVGNILQRRDASCEIKFLPVGKGDVRRITVDEFYGATKFCRQEFYQGALQDWRNGDPMFGTKILPFFKKALRQDIVSNLYFGDVSRLDSATATYSTNKFDGALTLVKRFVTSGAIPASQTFNIPSGDITPANAHAYLKSLVDKQPENMKVALPTDVAIYCDKALYDAYEDYLIATGAGTSESVNYVQDGIKVRAIKGIPIFANNFFNPVLAQVTGGVAHFAFLTFRGNIMLATDKSYGEGPSGNQALVVWYEWNELTWKYLQVMKLGMNIAAPELGVWALPA